MRRETPHWRHAARPGLWGDPANGGSHGVRLGDVAAAIATGGYEESRVDAPRPGDIAFTTDTMGRDRRLRLIGLDGRPHASDAISAAALRRRNREANELPILRIEIRHAGGTEVFHPTSLIMAMLEDARSIARLAPIAETQSVISGEPSIVYATEDIALPLTINELAGLVGLELRPAEAVRLAMARGDFHEIHDDFYCHISWHPLQPKGLRKLMRTA